MPATKTSTPITPASVLTGAGAMPSSSDHHVTASGSALTRAEMVISCAAPARISAARRHGGRRSRRRRHGRRCGHARSGSGTGECAWRGHRASWRQDQRSRTRRPGFPAHLATSINLGPLPANRSELVATDLRVARPPAAGQRLRACRGTHGSGREPVACRAARIAVIVHHRPRLQTPWSGRPGSCT